MQNEDARICRTCESRDKLFTIYDNERNISFKLMACAKIQVSDADSLPKLICSECISILDISYRFKLQCEAVDSKFRENIIKEENKQATQDDKNELIYFDHNIENITQTPSIIIQDKNENLCSDINDKNDSEHVGILYSEFDKSCSTSKYKIKRKSSKFQELLSKKKEYTEPLYSCSASNIVFNKYTKLEGHTKALLHNKYPCQICNKYFRDRTKLNKHLIIHEDVDDCEVYECLLCLKKYTSKGNLERHIRSHTDDKRHVCDVCGTRFIQSSTLKSHHLTHKQEKDYPCKDCEKAFKSKRYLLKHRENIHNVLHGDTYICDICSRRFINQRKLKWHMKHHVCKKNCDIPDNDFKSTGSVSAVCNYCGKTFKSIGQLNIHKRIHTGEKPYECSICKKTFSFNSSFKYHMHCHSGVRPYTCSVCNRSFRQPTHLKNHFVTHTGVKAFTCNFCNKNFAVKSNLKIHVRIHTGERPYVCSVCKQGFVDSNGLKKHIKRHVMI